MAGRPPPSSSPPPPPTPLLSSLAPLLPPLAPLLSSLAALFTSLPLPLLLLALPAAQAILVAPQSSCASRCGNNLGATSTEELVCNEDLYSTSAGTVFSGCVGCEIDSEWVYEDEATGKRQSDLQWMLCEFF
jgi:hypothetical protein